MRLTWSRPADLLPHAFTQARDEGVETSDLEGRWIAAGGSAEPSREGAGPVVSDELEELARRLLDAIDLRTGPLDERAQLPVAAEVPQPATPAPDELRDRLRGAWLGRAVGCVLGKPVEKIPRAGIREIAQATGNWPVCSYFTAVGLPEQIAQRWPWNRRSRTTSLIESIDGIPEDDDLNFPMLGLGLLEEHGAALTTDDVAAAWLAELPAGRVFTAERAAYRNLLDAVPPHRAALVRNPFREWIGAQIRTDIYGWAHPGDPVEAARLAEVDALLSHRRDGLYGARFAAACAAAALVAPDVTAVLATGLSVVPAQSRFAHAVRRGIELGRSGLDSEKCFDELHAEFGHLHWVHVLNNAALVGYALSAGAGDLATSISLAVTGGWDTDSDGATVGAVCGALSGAASLPQEWTRPLGETFHTSLPGFSGVTLNELTDRTMAVAA